MGTGPVSIALRGPELARYHLVAGRIPDLPDVCLSAGCRVKLPLPEPRGGNLRPFLHTS